MAVFQFNSHRVDLEFPGDVKISVPLTDDLNQKIKDAAQELLERSQAMKGSAGTPEDMEELCYITMDAIDAILGEGMADMILDVKEDYTFLDAADVFKFVTDEIAKGFASVSAAYGNQTKTNAGGVPAPANRAQRLRRSK